MIDRNKERQGVPTDPKTGKPYINTVAAVAIAPSGVGAELSG
ncbi:MAG: thiamine-binding protein, partial [Bifidobacterium mongoliense]|nr:thiamine-binding protein [Bifidobacterium mongoliense]